MYSLLAYRQCSRARLATWSVVALVFASCDPPAGPRTEGGPASIQIVSGDNQPGVVGTDLALPLVAKVVDTRGQGVRDQSVTFRVIAGAGAVTPSLVTSDEQGVVQARWTLDTSTAVAGGVEARVGSDTRGSGPAVTFRATALPGTATSVRKVSGDAQGAEAGASLADSLAVKVVDRFNNGVGRATVRWTVVSGGGTVSPATSTTDGTGVARTRWTPAAAGSAAVQAEVDAIPPVTFTATVTVPLVFASVSAGYFYSCGVTIAGAAYCWGSNGYGQLGDGSTTASAKPVAVTGGLSFTSVSAGVFQTCGITTSGGTFCWGSTPVALSGRPSFLAITLGQQHACGLTADGAAYCWGDNAHGALGTGDLTSSSTPTPVSGGLTFRSLSAGWDYTCGVTTDGTGYCWGRDGALGYSAGEVCDWDEPIQAPLKCSRRPATVESGLRLVEVGTGEAVTCGLTTDGAAHCWGSYPEGSWSGTPVAVPGGFNFVALRVGADRACGLTSGGGAYCWGWIPRASYQGEFSDAPAAVLGGLAFAGVSVGWFHSCGVTSSGTAYCWGGNANGELGDGSHTSSPVPVKVAGLQ